MPKTLFEKIWDRHVVSDLGDGRNLLLRDHQHMHWRLRLDVVEGE